MNVTIDWSSLPCGVPPIKTVLRFEIKADTAQIGCRDLFQLVDVDAGGPRPDGG